MISTSRVGHLIWVLIFAGMAVFGLGIAVGRSDDSLGFALMVFGVLLVLAGALLVWVRSRMKEPS